MPCFSVFGGCEEEIMDIFTLKSDFDGINLAVAMKNVEKPRAVLQIVHGMAEHKARYFPFMEYLAGRGIVCVINDHRGHGGSVSDKKELGYFGENGAEGLVEDLHQVTLEAKKRYPGAKFFMLGHSMGALAVRTYIQKYGGEIEGLIVSGNPGYVPIAPWGVKMAKRAQEKRGRLARCRLLTVGTLGPFILSAPSLRSMNNWISTDREIVREYDKDPMCGFEFYANGYEALLTLMVKANDPDGEAPNKEMPVKFFSGAKDACMGGEKALRDAAGRLTRAGYGDVQVKIYPGMRHEILNEVGRERVYADMADVLDGWICKENVDR